MKTVNYQIKGTLPLLTHNEQLADPSNEYARAIKAISDKKKKTEDDYDEMDRLEWTGGLYYNETSGIHVPGHNVFAALFAAGKLHKLGTTIKRALIVVEGALPIIFDGPKTPAALFANKSFVDKRGIKVGTSRVMRCRPRFDEWQLNFTIAYEESAIQRSDIDRCLHSASKLIGLCDYRPRFGLFEVLK